VIVIFEGARGAGISHARLSVPDFLEGRKGEAALATAVCWSSRPSSRRPAVIGAFSANVIRLRAGLCFLDAAVLATRGPRRFRWRQTALLAASGFSDSPGDAAPFEAFVIRGPRRVSLLSGDGARSSSPSSPCPSSARRSRPWGCSHGAARRRRVVMERGIPA
jgi:hypothetical protein